ncbi:MAG: DUF6484 domain-containing protein [Desulfobacterales bacterium]
MKSFLEETIQPIHDSEQINGVRVGKFVDVDENGRVFVDYTGNPQNQIAARFTSSLQLQALHQTAFADQDVLLVFENNDPLCPIIIHTLSSTIDEIVKTEEIDLKVDNPKDITTDGKKYFIQC